KDPPSEVKKGLVYYNLGWCHASAQNSQEAASAWEAAAASGGEAGQAAALRLAELHLAGDKPAAAIDMMRLALEKVSQPADYKNPFIDLAQDREQFEKTGKVFQDAHAYEMALQLAELYQRLGPPGRASSITGKIAETWAREIKKKTAHAPPAQAKA